MKTVNILGQPYKVFLRDTTDPRLETADGYCDHSVKEIVIRSDIPETVSTLSDLSIYQRCVLRHEIIHAFLHESGLDANSWGNNEEIVDWIALQFEKISAVIDIANQIWEEERSAAE